MDSSILLEETYKLIQKIENTKNQQEKELLFDQNFEQFIQFYFDISLQIRLYQYKNLEDNEQCEKADKFLNILKWMIKNSELFSRNEDFGHMPDAILDEYYKREEFHTSRINSIYLINCEKEHFKARNEIEELLKEKIDISNAQKRYLMNHVKYYKYFYGHTLSFFDTHFTDVSDEEILEILKEIDELHFIEEIINLDNKKYNFENVNLIFQYIKFVLKMKSIFRPNDIYKDTVIQAFWNGDIKDQIIIEFIFNQKENEEYEKKKKTKVGQIFDYEKVLKQLLKQNGWNGEDFYINLINHFVKVGISTENINFILKNIIPILGPYEATELLVDINKCPQIRDNMYLVELLQNEEKQITEGDSIEIPFTYALKSIPNMSKNMKQNLLTLLHSNFYTEEEKKVLYDELKKYKIIDEDKIQKEPITFDENDSIEDIVAKLNLAYYNRQVVPIEIAIKILKLYSEHNLILTTGILKPCIVSIINNELKQYGIEINSNVYFGNSEKRSGQNLDGTDFQAIWINRDLLTNYKKYDDISLFITMFHEIRHSIQSNNIENGDIDFLTYNFIIEKVIRENDPDFYAANYFTMFIEEDARQYGIIDALVFLKKIGILRDEDIEKCYEDLKHELNNSNIAQDSFKENPFRTKEKINISDYLERMIKNNPTLLNKYNGILKIGFNIDGTTKDIVTLLREYRALGEMDEKKRKNMYSIYYGLISSKINKDLKLPEDVEADLTEFMKEKRELISVADMRYFFKQREPLVTSNIAKHMLSDAVKKQQSREGQYGKNE